MTLDELVREIVRSELARAAPAPVSARMTTREAAEYAKVNPGTIRRWVRLGRLSADRAGQRIRIDRVELDALMKCNGDLSDAAIDAMARRQWG